MMNIYPLGAPTGETVNYEVRDPRSVARDRCGPCQGDRTTAAHPARRAARAREHLCGQRRTGGLAVATAAAALGTRHPARVHLHAAPRTGASPGAVAAGQAFGDPPDRVRSARRARRAGLAALRTARRRRAT